MSSNALVIIVSMANLLVIAALLYMIWQKMEKRRGSETSDRAPVNNIQNDILERLKKLETETIAHDTQPDVSNGYRMKKAPIDRVNLALDKLNKGVSLDNVGRELGYSRSEMGILMASAKRDRAPRKPAANALQ